MHGSYEVILNSATPKLLIRSTVSVTSDTAQRFSLLRSIAGSELDFASTLYGITATIMDTVGSTIGYLPYRRWQSQTTAVRIPIVFVGDHKVSQ
ncbi:hypothetical protein L484_021511 [Morus notabilis]|uniref:Uncharacterized protein n=1 Tax=Morus notabilis TaxID=981085 RepID=W9RSE8_9ROSA|nr:hypothetical protein L484_021511 [Morus notabilis]